MYETIACSGRIIDKNGNTKAHICVRVCNSCQQVAGIRVQQSL